MNQKKAKNNDRKRIMVIAAVAVLLLIAVFNLKNPLKSEDATGKTVNSAAEVTDHDIVIPVSDVTEDARFYPAVIDGTRLEVIAVKAPDGTIRTAFNTCQVCYSSGKGYYKQEGDQLVCQNCGNHFAMSEVAVSKGGCNPVPITDDYKTTDDKNITISKDILEQAVKLFAKWKTNS